MKKIILMTGGGSAGHVTPNIALMPRLADEGFDIHYVGMAGSIEQKLVQGRPGVTYHTITSGKFRRYFSWKNFTDPFRVVKGVFQAKRIIRSVKPDVVFSKGGFVSVPVCIAARRKAPVVVHESDYTPGLANRIGARFADTVCVTFSDTLNQVGAKGVHTGTPIRPELYNGKREKGLEFLGFKGDRPILLVMGGSLGALAVNEAVRGALKTLTVKYDIVHLCGEGKMEPGLDMAGYAQYEYIASELPDVFAAVDIVISRAGANAVFELLALKKPAVLIPLPASSSRGDQIHNAGYFARKGYALYLKQSELTADTLLDAVEELFNHRLEFVSAMNAEPAADGTEKVLNVIKKAAQNRQGSNNR